ncbi:hypothetical protein EcCFBP13530_22975 [Enterobacter cancerogenus]|uniref:HTH cro/C1-type domain-containing protein n=1 Tax=Enterobacter cancerogenus TaxID=69218 RepID=A0AB38NYA9_9ENTR|nr:hypothetical protein [Enterobacter cancerogenus]TKK13667.1 hypothetical protein EcCFBP13530_22975 [Enterobacter cancerogenus]
MNVSIHPAVKVLKDEIIRSRHSYNKIAAATHISSQRLKNIMTGRADITLRERDILCEYLDISPIFVVMRRNDIQERLDFLDLRGLPESMKKSLIILHHEICQLAENLKS